MLLDTVYKPSPNDVNHQSLEQRVKSYLEQNDYTVQELTYHSMFPKSVTEILSRRWSMTALYLRGRADRIAIHKTKPIEFEWEAKTHHNPRYSDLTIEFLPLVHHISKVKLGVKCLYVFNINGVDGGFWAHDLPQIRQIHFPPRVEYNLTRKFIMPLMKSYFPNASIYESVVNGSNDPFVIFDKSVIGKSRHWKELIDELLDCVP